MLTFNDTSLQVTFSRWGPDEYDMFIKSKQLPEQNIEYDWEADTYRIIAPARFAHVFGINPP